MSKGKKDHSVTIGVVQMRMSENPDENMEKALAMTREAIGKGAEVVCLPELFRSRYFCQTEDADFFERVAAQHDVPIGP